MVYRHKVTGALITTTNEVVGAKWERVDVPAEAPSAEPVPPVKKSRKKAVK